MANPILEEKWPTEMFSLAGRSLVVRGELRILDNCPARIAIPTRIARSLRAHKCSGSMSDLSWSILGRISSTRLLGRAAGRRTVASAATWLLSARCAAYRREEVEVEGTSPCIPQPARRRWWLSGGAPPQGARGSFHGAAAGRVVERAGREGSKQGSATTTASQDCTTTSSTCHCRIVLASQPWQP
jgi:hypothetical protein